MDPKDILSNLSTHLKNTVARGIQYAATLRHKEVSPLHLLIAISDENGCLGAEILQKLGIKKEAIERLILLVPFDPSIPGEKPTMTLPELNKNARTALEKAMLMAYEYGHKYVGTEHLLFGLIEINDKHVIALLNDLHIQKKEIETK